jgi:flagellar basal-body rod modification protein FlgD
MTISAASSHSTISLQDFLQVLTTQLTYQDPLKPMDNDQFMAQIAQFTTLEQTQQLNTNIQQLVSSQAAQQSIGLIGHAVNITTESGPLTGSVTSVNLSGASPTLSVTTKNGVLTGISFSQITSVN